MGSERKGRAQQVVYRAGNETDRCGRAGEVNSCSQRTCFPGRPSLWISRVHLLELGPGRLLERKGLWETQGMGAFGKGRLQQFFCSRARDKTGDWIRKNRGSPPASLEGLVCWLSFLEVRPPVDMQVICILMHPPV